MEKIPNTSIIADMYNATKGTDKECIAQLVDTLMQTKLKFKCLAEKNPADVRIQNIISTAKDLIAECVTAVMDDKPDEKQIMEIIW